jgi:5-methylcytosine-specific restriction enzyme A
MKRLILLFCLIPILCFSKERSNDWPKVRKQYLQTHNRCEVCGSMKDLQVHHIKPFHDHPELELDWSNLITLCTSKYWGFNCHLVIGHGMNWKYENPYIWQNIEEIKDMVKQYNYKFNFELQDRLDNYFKLLKNRVRLYNRFDKNF